MVLASDPLAGSVSPKQPNIEPEANGFEELLFLRVGAKLVERVAYERIVDAHDNAGRRAQPFEISCIASE